MRKTQSFTPSQQPKSSSENSYWGKGELDMVLPLEGPQGQKSDKNSPTWITKKVYTKGMKLSKVSVH